MASTLLSAWAKLNKNIHIKGEIANLKVILAYDLKQWLDCLGDNAEAVKAIEKFLDDIIQLPGFLEWADNKVIKSMVKKFLKN
jgi:hypothetical protein